MKKYLIATGLVLLTGTTFAQQYEGPQKSEREAWANQIKAQQEMLRLEQAKAAEATESQVANTTPSVTQPVVVQQTSTVVPVKTHAVKVEDGMTESGTPIIVEKRAETNSSSLGNSPLPTARDAQKEAEIRDRIKAATTDGKPGKR